MKTILSILNELASTVSTNEKVAIIEREKDNELLKRVFQAAYNPMINYYQKAIPDYAPRLTSAIGFTLGVAIDSLSILSSRKVTGNAAIEYLDGILHNLDKDDAIVLERIITKDLRCGTSDTLASRVWPGLVPTFDVMLSHKDISGIKFPAYIQEKSDGARCHLYFDGAHAKAVSRSGKEIMLHNVMDNDIGMLIQSGQTLDGELVCYRDGVLLDRKTGNGIVNKAIKGTITPEEAKLIHFHSWDIVDFSSTIPYSTRITSLTYSVLKAKSFDAYEGRITVLDTEIVNSKEEAGKFFEKCLSEGKEGAMCKNVDMLWEPKRSKNIGKMKAIETADLKIVGLQEGSGKYVGMLGAFVCETSDGLLRVNVGTGLRDQDRSDFWDDLYLDKIIEVKYNQLITSKGKDIASVFLPRFMGIREDKTVANSLSELK